MKHLLTKGNAYHFTGVVVTAASAKASLPYLSTFSNGDQFTTIGFAAAIGMSAVACWSFAFRSKTPSDAIIPVAFGLLTTVVSGYTVYQSSIIPLEQAAIAAAQEADKPLRERYEALKAQYQASKDNLQLSIDDLRKQKAGVEADKSSVPDDDKSRAWKLNQIQHKLDALQTDIDSKVSEQQKLQAPTLTESPPAPISTEQRTTNLIRSFFYELIAIAFIYFAARSRREAMAEQQAAANPLLDAIRQLHTALEAAQKADQYMDEKLNTLLSKIDSKREQMASFTKEAVKTLTEEATKTASAAVTACNNATKKINQAATSMEQLAEATAAASAAVTACNNATQTITTQTVASLEELAEATAAASAAVTACNNATQTITTQTVASLEELAEATTAASAAINPAESLRLQLVAAIDQAERAATVVKIEIAKAAELQTSPLQVQTSPANVVKPPEIKRPTLEQTILLLKNGGIEANKFGQISVSIIQKISGLGRDLATEAQEEALRLGYLVRQPNGYCYYPTPSTATNANVVQIPPNRRA